MTSKIKSIFSRIKAQCLKPAFAIFAACIVGALASPTSALADAAEIAATLNNATAADNVVVTLAGETVEVDSITAASLTVNGYGKINVAGNVSVSGELAFAPSSAVSTSIKASEGAYTLKLDVEGSVSSGTIAGGGTIDAAMGVTTSGGTFYGAVTGATTLNITANATLQGRNNLTGGLNISGGITTLGAYDYSQLVKFDFDTTDRSRWTVDSSDNSVSKLWTKTGGCPGGQLAYSHFESYGSSKAIVSQSESIFGNQPYLALVDGVNYSYNNDRIARGRANAWLAVYRVENSSGAGKLLFEGNNSSNNGYLNLNSSAVWASRSNGVNNDSLVFVDGVRTTQGEFGKAQTVMSFTGVCVNDNRFAVFTSNNASYPGITGALGQIIGFETRPSVEQYLAINAIMMQKWKCDYHEKCQILPTTAPVTLSSGAVLDLNNYKETIKSISGSGTVRNGTLTVTDAVNLAAGDVLTLPTSATFTLGTVAAKVVNGDTVTLYGSVQNAIDNYAAGTLTILASETVAVGKEVTISGIVEANGAVLTVTDVAPFSATFENGTLTATRVASTFVYTGAAAYSPTSGNFTIGGVATTAVPDTADTVQFDSAVTIDTSSTSYMYAAVVANATVTVNGSNSYYLFADSFSGTGKIALGNYARLATATGTATISCELEVNAASATPAYLHVADTGREITLTGVLSGSGYLKCTRAKNKSNYSGCTFHCSDTIDFDGTIEMVHDGSDVGRNLITFWPTCDLSAAKVIVGNYRSGYGRFIEGQSDSTVYKFGSLSGYVSPSASNVANSHPTIEIGALNQDDTVTGNWMPHASRNPTIRKVGTGTFTTSAINAYGYILNGGTLVVMAGAEATVTTELTGYEVVSVETLDTEGEDPTAVLYTTYTLKSNKITWTGEGGDSNWTTAGNWSGNAVPTATDFVVFEDDAEVVVPTWATSMCKYMTVNGNVTLRGATLTDNCYCLDVHGGTIDGTGTLTLVNCGLWNATENSNVAISPNIVVESTGVRNQFSRIESSSGTFTITGSITVDDGAKLKLANVTATASTITLDVGAWLVVPSSATVNTENIVVSGSTYFETTDDSNPAYVNNTASTWIGGASGDWMTGSNWSSGVYPRADTDVTFTPGDDSANPASYTVYVGNDSTWAEGMREKCRNMVVNGYVTLAAKNSADGCHLCIFGNESGTGILTLSKCGLDNATWPYATVTIASKFCVSSAGQSQFTNRDIGFNVTGDAEFWGDFLVGGPSTFTNLALKDDVTVTIYNSWTDEDSAYHQKGITVVNLTVASGAQAGLSYGAPSATTVDATITGTVALEGADSTLAIPANASVSAKQFKTLVVGKTVTSSTVEGVTTYSVIDAPSVSVASVSATYGVDFTNATVTATLTGATAGQSYTMTVGGKSYNGEATDGGTVTFNDVAVTYSSVTDKLTYEITSNDASVSGGSGSKDIADVADWFSTSASGTTGGSWNVSPWANENGGVVTSDNSFTPTAASSASVVDVTLQVCFGDANDDDIELTDAKAAVKIATVNNDLVFQALNDGMFVTLTGVTPDPAVTYNVALRLDYVNHRYSVNIGGTQMLYNESQWLAMPSTATAMTAVAFQGQGTLTSLVGTESEGYVAMDAAGNRYATLEAAMLAGNQDHAKLPLTVLHDGTLNNETYEKSAQVLPVGVNNVTINAADQAAADVAAANMQIVLTSDQVTQGLKKDYYKAVATKSGEDDTYTLSIELDETEVAPTVAADEDDKAMEVSATSVSLNVTNTKVGLYYGIAAGDTPEAVPVAAGTMTKCDTDGEDLNLTAEMPESGVKYYKVIVSDVGNN